jgi:hypothetical protein
MPKKGFSEEQIAFALRQAESGTPVGEVRAGSVCLNSFPGFISGASAGFRPPREAAAV